MDEARELFIQQLVAALEENSVTAKDVSSTSLSTIANDGPSSNASAFEGEHSSQEVTGLFHAATLSPSTTDPVRLAHDAYTQLQYDFPQVQEASIEALAELYRRLPSGTSRDFAIAYPITTILLDNVNYLNDHNVSDPINRGLHVRNSEASGLLAAAILLRIVRVGLELPTDATVHNVLSALVPQQRLQTLRDDKMTHNVGPKLDQQVAAARPHDNNEVEKQHFASCVQSPMIKTTEATSVSGSLEAKLAWLASRTYSSTFHTVSMAKWEQWQLDDDLVTIIKLLIGHQRSQDEKNTSTNDEGMASTLYGVTGEWSRYLFVLRDRVLRFPATSRHSLWQLKELLDFFHNAQVATFGNMVSRPQELVYRVLAELATSPDFQVQKTRASQQWLSTLLGELLPLMMQELHHLVAASSATSDYANVQKSDMATVLLQLLHYLLDASATKCTTTEKLYESGMLRTLLLLLPSETEDAKEIQCYVPALLRLVAECALWHAAFATYLSRVATFCKVLPMLHEHFVAETVLVALAFHQHQVQLENGSHIDIWATFRSNALFPTSCASNSDVVNKLQHTLFVLNCLDKGVSTLRPVVQNELQDTLQHLYSNLKLLFQYPEATTQQGASHEKTKDRKEAEARHYTALQHQVRQRLKSLLAALSSDTRATSSKLD